ncbi:MAG: serine/threonine protein kinase [Myxococcaceae bacterium]|nr:serine/threonine protein kinase [Myxococcaceae bacterium]
MSRQPTTEPAENVPPGFKAGAFTYAFVRELATRGPASIFLATRYHLQERLQEQVLIKRLHDSKDRSARLRLLEEARLGLTLRHPAITRVLEVAVHDGRPHLVMEYVEGLSLDRVVNKAARRHQPVSAPFAAYVAAEIADALHYAHTRTDEHGHPLQLVHRDVSPRNILLSASGAVKLGDFGAALTAAPERPRTDGPMLKGDVAYAAPEVLRLEPPDARADVFSLGLILMELLTFQHPYYPPEQAARAPLVGLFAELHGRLRAEEPGWTDPAELAAIATRLHPADVERAAAHVPAPLRQVMARALRVPPHERYATAAVMRDELRHSLATSHGRYGPAEVVAELRDVLAMAAREHGEVQTSHEPIPTALRAQRPLRH